jgi:hypothetical protein
MKIFNLYFKQFWSKTKSNVYMVEILKTKSK